jgi:hypothetical protein
MHKIVRRLLIDVLVPITPPWYSKFISMMANSYLNNFFVLVRFAYARVKNGISVVSCPCMKKKIL